MADELVDRPVDAVHRDPAAAEAHARRVLESSEDVSARATALWTLGLVHRERSEHDQAIERLREAIETAPPEDRALRTEVGISLALQLGNRGDFDDAVATLEDLEAGQPSDVTAKLTLQRGVIRYRQGLLDEAAALFERALVEFDRLGDRENSARLLATYGLVELRRGHLESARLKLRRSIELAQEIGLSLCVAVARHNLGFLELQHGDVAACLSELRVADDGYRELENLDGLGLVAADRGAAFASAGMINDAAAAADDAVAQLRKTDNQADLADVLVLAAHLYLTDGRTEDAALAAVEAESIYRGSGREAMAGRAEILALEARANDVFDAADVDRALSLAAEMAERGWLADAAHASVVAAEAAFADTARVREALEAFEPLIDTASADDEVRMMAVVASNAFESGDLATAREGIERAFARIDGLSNLVGAIELRSWMIAGRGRTLLTNLALRIALHSGDPMELLVASENVRALTTVRSAGRRDAELAEALTDLRVIENEVRIQTDIAAEERRALIAERSRREQRARITSLERRPAGLSIAEPLETSLRNAPKDWLIAVYVPVGDAMHVIVRQHGAVSSVHEVDFSEVATAVESLDFSLQRLSRGQLSDRSRQAAIDAMEVAASAIEGALVPPAVSGSSQPVVLVPSVALPSIPWGALPFAQRRPLVVAPSIRMWSAASVNRRDSVSAAAVAGPELEQANREVERVASVVPSCGVVDSDHASVSRVLAEFAEADVVHLACHGSFRQDNPMFSSLLFADGQLNVYDLEQCERLPHTIVMSACNAGQNTARDGRALLGMATALIQLGVSSVIAPLTPVNDERSVDLMVRLHAHLSAGREPADALAAASVGPHGELDPTAAAFICFGS